MKAGVLAAAEPADKSWWAIGAELVKARLTLLVLVTTAVGFAMGTTGDVRLILLLHTLLGTALVAASAAILNQWIERERDGCMHRTRGRPLPAGQVKPGTAFVAGVGAALVGVSYLWWMVGWLTALLGTVTLLVYLLVYTPLKLRTPWNTLVGAVPGALPPVMGWSAARDSWSAEAWVLFAILAAWQLPHFLAIAWIYREDYARAGYRMLPAFDPQGCRTAGQALTYSVVLLVLSLGPYYLGMVRGFYVVGALILGGVFIWQAVCFRRRTERGTARGLFLASIGYLPALLVLMLGAKN